MERFYNLKILVTEDLAEWLFLWCALEWLYWRWSVATKGHVLRYDWSEVILLLVLKMLDGKAVVRETDMSEGMNMFNMSWN